MLFDVALCTAFIGGTVVLTLATYLLMRAITGGDPEEKGKDLANSIIGRIAALHGLILALVFAQEMIGYQQLKYGSATEANAIADVYYDAERYGGEERAPIQKALAEYLRLVIAEEWKRLGDIGRLSPSAWEQWDIAYRGVLDLVPTTERQKSLRDHMLKEIHTISETRVRRENNAESTVSGIFWFAALAGLFFVAFAFYPHPPEWRNLFLISMFGAYTGIILFFIYGFSNPFDPPAALNPSAYERLAEEMRKPMPSPPPPPSVH